MAKPSQTELAIQEIEQRYLGLLEISGEAILIVCESKIVFASKAAGELLGFAAADQLSGLSHLDFISPKYRNAVSERINGLAAPGQTAPFIHRKLLRADGKI